MTFVTRKTLLEAASLIVAAFGLLTALAALPALAAPTVLLADIIFWPPDGVQSLGAPEARLLSAITGGVLAGWGMMMWLLVRKLFVAEPNAVKAVILGGMFTWYAIDSTFSAIAGAPFNAVLNVPFLLLFLLPLRGAIARPSHI
jgi:hypothetical protein